MARSSVLLRSLALVATASCAWHGLLDRLLGHGVSEHTFVQGPGMHRLGAYRGEKTCRVILEAAKKKSGETISHGDTVYIKCHTGKYIGELDGTTKIEWVKARGTKKDKEHALKLERDRGDGPVESGDTVMIVMPNEKHIDVMGSAVRARNYNPRGEDMKLTIVKKEGGPIHSGDQIFIKGPGRDYLDGSPPTLIPDGEIKARWPDQGDWQVMWIEK
eukprot:TRINITY_DN483_c0_g2_i1.p1 TRINITY_DN483_c0_g2~~TRINITY_DN483_c0_g2_i1.p1  ORF type:complete len:217 (+),score=47.50 TRINITY_DN483_c0_g2_i1:55-705(+)